MPALIQIEAEISKARQCYSILHNLASEMWIHSLIHYLTMQAYCQYAYACFLLYVDSNKVQRVHMLYRERTNYHVDKFDTNYLGPAFHHVLRVHVYIQPPTNRGTRTALFSSQQLWQWLTKAKCMWKATRLFAWTEAPLLIRDAPQILLQKTWGRGLKCITHIFAHVHRKIWAHSTFVARFMCEMNIFEWESPNSLSMYIFKGP